MTPGFFTSFYRGFSFFRCVDINEHCTVAGFYQGIGYFRPLEKMDEELGVLYQFTLGFFRLFLHKLFYAKSCTSGIVYPPALGKSNRRKASGISASSFAFQMFIVSTMYIRCRSGIVVAVFYLQYVYPLVSHVIAYL